MPVIFIPHIAPHITPHPTPHPTPHVTTYHTVYHPPIIIYMPLLHHTVTVPAYTNVERDDDGSGAMIVAIIGATFVIGLVMFLFFAWLEARRWGN